MTIANGGARRRGRLAARGETLAGRDRPGRRARAGLIVANPPYGERIGAESGLPALYSELGAAAARPLSRLAGRDSHGQSAARPQPRDLRQAHAIGSINGTIECRLLRFELNEASEQRPAEAVRADWSGRPGAQMFANRLRKNLQRLEPWAEREHIDCYRVYDADMPEYAFAIDLYGRGVRHVYVQEYAPPKTVDQESARRAPPRGAGGAAGSSWRCRFPRCTRACASRRRAHEQYEKRDAQGERHAVQEGGLKFWVNFRDYLDTGLFLDHRIVRGMLRELGSKAPIF